mmetsp:Transcript_23336/g.35357  ORF Transcript_23336/g.35357 Transcript_23336/m.35357 type:complete len:103 (-) Transcript_23336:26-334(-)
MQSHFLHAVCREVEYAEGVQSSLLPSKSCSNSCTTLCQYFDRGRPGEIIKNERVASDTYAERFLPVEFLQRNHTEEIKDVAKNKEAFVLYGGWMDKHRNFRP